MKGFCLRNFKLRCAIRDVLCGTYCGMSNSCLQVLTRRNETFSNVIPKCLVDPLLLDLSPIEAQALDLYLKQVCLLIKFIFSFIPVYLSQLILCLLFKVIHIHSGFDWGATAGGTLGLAAPACRKWQWWRMQWQGQKRTVVCLVLPLTDLCWLALRLCSDDSHTCTRSSGCSVKCDRAKNLSCNITRYSWGCWCPSWPSTLDGDQIMPGSTHVWRST